MKKLRKQYESSIVKGEAQFSEDGNHRYFLQRVWNKDLPMAAAIMLNPTDADALYSDKTLMKLMNDFVEQNYGGFYVVNLFSYIAKREGLLLEKTSYDDRYDKNTDFWISHAIKNSENTYIAWGSNKNRVTRIKQVIKILKKLKKETVYRPEDANGNITHFSWLSNDYRWVEIKVDDILN
ncbi:hypothetical protein QFZ28_006016 [Neobacillus niacini]|uniref:DUF1643 domain-containing protein n=1 Tax=Neobacillus niacini TaxID=86668 RepID=UPI00278393AC|nr:DUF1643 domain-containing protein [Neobacillus niacini]MDQ1005438.1 hypothetical protein [Neobacillus niacini]